MSKKLKTYLASSIPVWGVPKDHRGSNGNSQCTVVVRTTSQKRAAEILGVSVRYLREYGGIQDRTGEKWDSVCLEDETAYYQPGCTRKGLVHDWFPIPV